MLLSFHVDEIHPDALRKPLTIYFSMAEPLTPDEDLDENSLFCSYVFDPLHVSAGAHNYNGAVRTSYVVYSVCARILIY